MKKTLFLHDFHGFLRLGIDQHNTYMNNTSLLSLTSVLLLSTTNSYGTFALFENFEDGNAPKVQYTLNDFTGGSLGAVLAEASDLPGATDYASTLRYTDHPENITANGLLNRSGDKYFGFEDVNSTDTHGSSVDQFALQWLNLDIAAYGTNYSFSASFGEIDANFSEDWDSNDSLTVWASKDGGLFVQVFGIESQVGTTAPFVDTNFDGVGDGAEITRTMTKHEVDLGSLLGAGSFLDIQIRTGGLSSGTEDIAIDNVLVVPEPSTPLLFAFFSCIPLLRRSRK